MREVPPVDSAEQAGADEGGMEHEVSHESRSKFALMNGIVENPQDGAWIKGGTPLEDKIGERRWKGLKLSAQDYCTAAHRKDEPSAVS